MIDAAPESVGFPRLDDGQLAVVDGLGQRRTVEIGEVLFSPADAAYDWMVLVTASADIVGANGETIVRHGPRGFLGEVSLVTRQRPYLTARVAGPGEVIVVPAEVFRSRVLSDVRLSDTVLEARACGGAPVLVVGGGNSAGQAAMFLAEHATSVCIAVRRPLAATMSSYLVERIEAHPRIAVHEATTVVALAGTPTLQSATLSSGEQTVTVDCAALFSFIGAEPNSGWLGDVATDEHGFVRTDHALSAADLDAGWDTLGRPPLPFETSRPGLFAVGDLRAGSTKRVAGAVGEGSAAIRSIHQYLDHRH